MKIENPYYVLEINPLNGAIQRIFDKKGSIELITEPRLAENFRILLPLPHLQANYILSSQQSEPEISCSDSSLTIHWTGPLTNEQGQFPIDITTVIAFVDDHIQFNTSATNNTPYQIAELWHAGLGGITGMGPRLDTEMLIPSYGNATAQDLFQNFPESMGIGGGGGMRFPEFFLEHPRCLSMPWTDMFNRNLQRGVYFGCHDQTPRQSVLRFEMHPGMARNRLSGNWPTEQESAAMAQTFPTGVIMHWVHMPYTKHGETFHTPPIVLRCHPGDWHVAAKWYRNWFLEHFPIRHAKDSWLRQQQAVQDAMFLLPEGNVMLTFKDIPQWARDAADHGVKTVMISGWNIGGHDNTYPAYTPDPRLGTWEDLTQAIEACHAMGVNVLFFSNIQYVDTSADWFHKELHAYGVTTSRDNPQGVGGWGMGTLSARMGYTCAPCGMCDPAFPEYRKIIVDQMRKLAEIGADGIHYDKVGGGYINFNPQLPANPDQGHSQGIIKCLEETLDACRPINPDFCLGIESHWDRLLSYCDAWWLWHDFEHTPVLKYTFPEFLPTFAVAQPWDFVNVNRTVQYGYQLLVGPVRYSASMADPQTKSLSNYIKEIIRIREHLKDTIFLGDFLDDLEVDVQPAPNLTYKTHRNPTTGKRACVLVNQGTDPLETHITFDNNTTGAVSIHRPFTEPQTHKLPVDISIPGERLAIVVEE